MQGANAVLNVVTVPPGATQTSPRIVIDGVRGAIFVYGSGGPVGSLIGSWSGAAGTDPYGNNYPAGFQISVGAIIASLIETASSVPQVQIDGTRNAIFVYDASSNLLVSLAAVGGTDFFGHTYPAGLQITVNISGTSYKLTFGVQNNFPTLAIAQATSGPVLPVLYGSNAAASSGSSAYINSGQSTVIAGTAELQVEDSVFSGVTNGQIELLSGKINFGNSLAMQWMDATTQLNLPVSGGPFVTGETFHSITLASGVTGTLRVKKVPWNGIWVDAQLANTVTGTINLGSLPDATYYPTTARNIPLSATVAGATAYLHIPTSGALQLIVSANQNPGGSFVYPTN